MFDSLFPKEWTTLQRLMWLKTNALARAVYETITGNPVSFTAKAAPLRQLKVAFSPVQSLNGYDAPWPAGGGKNKLPFDLEWIKANNHSDYGTWSGNAYTLYGVSFTFNDDGTVLVNGTATSNTFIPFYDATFLKDSPSGTYTLNGCPAGGSGSTYNMDVQGASGADSGNGVSINYSTTLSNSTVRIRIYNGATLNNLLFKPMIRLSSVSDATYSPYSNECPISGWDSLNVEQRGVNMWDEEWEEGDINTSTGEVSGAGRIITKNFVPIVGGQTYRHRERLDFFYYDENKTFLMHTNFIGTAGVSSILPVPNGVAFLKFRGTTQYGTTYHDNISINYPSTDTDYHAYNPSSRSISISLGQTTYSGYVDVVSGVGEITWVAVDMGELSWRYITNDGDPYFRSGPNNRKTGYNNLLCSLFKVMQYSGTARLENVAIVGSTSGNYVFARWFAYTDATAFKTAVTGQTLCYELATPIPIQLTPQEVESLAGDNVLFSDANGDLTVEYRSN